MEVHKMKCIRCKNSFKIPFKSALIMTINGKKYTCEKCVQLTAYENNNSFSTFASFYDFDLCCIRRYDEGLYGWWKNNVGNDCAVKLKNGEIFGACIKSFIGGDICFSISGEEKNFLIMDIDSVKIIQDSNDYYKYVKKYNRVLGYKGLRISDGILYTERYIYELGIPYEEDIRDPFKTDYQDVYSHFCTSIEDVFLWRDCITASVRNVEEHTYCDEYRIFKVCAEDHCFQNTEGGWVANKLTVLSEVLQSEIIDYFEKNPDIKKSVIMKLEKENKTTDLWSRYKKVVINPYSNTLSDDEITELCVKSAPMYGKDECIAIGDYKKCFICKKFQYCFEKCKQNSLNYLRARKRIMDRTFDYSCKEYAELVNANAKKEFESLQRLVQKE